MTMQSSGHSQFCVKLFPLAVSLQCAVLVTGVDSCVFIHWDPSLSVGRKVCLSLASLQHPEKCEWLCVWRPVSHDGYIRAILRNDAWTNRMTWNGNEYFVPISSTLHLLLLQLHPPPTPHMPHPHPSTPVCCESDERVCFLFLFVLIDVVQHCFYD